MANNTEDVEQEATHYQRVCLLCGVTWWGLHCPHDGYQNPCPSCNQRPAPVPTEDDTCELVMTQQEANRQKAELLDRIEKAKPDFSDMDSYNRFFLKVMYENTVDKAIEAERKQLKEVSNG